MRWLDGITDSMDVSLSELQEPSEWTAWISLQSKDSQESSPTPQFKSINSSALSLLHSPTLTCLENPRDGGAWWAAVHWVTQSRTRLKRLSRSSSSELNTMGCSPPGFSVRGSLQAGILRVGCHFLLQGHQGEWLSKRLTVRPCRR